MHLTTDMTMDTVGVDQSVSPAFCHLMSIMSEGVDLGAGRILNAMDSRICIIII